MSEFGSWRESGGQLGEKLMLLCNIQGEVGATPLGMILKLRQVFAAGAVALGGVNLQIVIGTMKVEEMSHKKEEKKRGKQRVQVVTEIKEQLTNAVVMPHRIKMKNISTGLGSQELLCVSADGHST